MFARVTLAEIDPVRMSPAAAVERFKTMVLPELQQQAGYQGIYLLTTPEGKALVISFWSSEQAEESNVASGYYEAQLAKFVTVFRSPPGREEYEVALAETPQAAMS
jgi:heme-degrading monooxygenase HmoA